jgi:hypothetical protein
MTETVFARDVEEEKLIHSRRHIESIGEFRFDPGRSDVLLNLRSGMKVAKFEIKTLTIALVLGRLGFEFTLIHGSGKRAKKTKST